MTRSTPSRIHHRPRARLAQGGLLAIVLLGLACGGDIESRMAEVRALQDVGQFTASIEELREILAINPDLPEANYRLGIALVQTGEPTRAIWALQKASESVDYAIVAGLMLANAHYTIENYEDAIRAVDRVLELDPERMVALTLRAQANLGAGRLEESLKDTERLLELYPDDYRVRVLHATVLADLGRIDDKYMEAAEKANYLVKEIGLASGDPNIEPRSCLAPAMFARDNLEDNELAEDLYNDCLERFPNDAFLVGQAMRFFDGIGKRDRSTELIRASVEAAPENLSLRATLSQRLRNDGKADEAEAVLVEAAESFGTAAAWNLLVNFYRAERNSEKALASLEKVMELTGGGSDQLRFSHADVLVDLGELDRAEEVAKSLNEPIYGKLIQGRILLARGDAKGALESFEQGIRRWPNNAGARYLAGMAAYQLGDFDRAISELREAARADMAGTEAAFVLARLYFDRADYVQAISFANGYLAAQGRPQAAEAQVIAARAFRALGEYDKARSQLQKWREHSPDDAPRAVAELAGVTEAESGPEAAIAVIEGAGLDLTDPANEPALRAMAEYLTTVGRSDDAVALASAAARANPEVGAMQEIHGAILARAERVPEARAAYEKALEIDAENAAAIGGLATLQAQAGDLAGAVEKFDRAADLAPNEPSFAYAAAQLVLAAGNRDDAMERFREVVRQAPGHAGARNDLAWLMAESGQDLDQALALAEEARRMDPSADILDTLGYVHLKRGEASEAVDVLEVAVEANPESPSIRYRLATALREAGNAERAAEMLRKALASGTFPEADDARRQLAQLETP